MLWMYKFHKKNIQITISIIYREQKSKAAYICLYMKVIISSVLKSYIFWITLNFNHLKAIPIFFFLVVDTFSFWQTLFGIDYPQCDGKIAIFKIVSVNFVKIFVRISVKYLCK